MANKKQLYILVADSGRAKVFKGETPLDNLELVFDQVNFHGRQKASEIYSDRAGSQRSGRGGYHSFAGERDAHEEYKFSRELCRFLCEEHRTGKYSELVLIAPPQFLGVLRKHLEKECGTVPLQTLDKDLVKQSEQDIIDSILENLPELNLKVM